MVWFEPDDSYFVIGGDTDVQYNSHPTDEVRRYSKKSGWSNIAPLPERVRGAQAISIHGRIYVIGNFSTIFCHVIYHKLWLIIEKDILKNLKGGDQFGIYSIDPLRDSNWKTEATMNTQRTDFGKCQEHLFI